MRIAIVGSRGYPKLEEVDAYVDSLDLKDVVISGGAAGVDWRAEDRARSRGLEVRVFLPDWTRYGKRAGLMRNVDIVAAAEKVVAFWDGESRGTAHTIQTARNLRRKVEVHKP